MLADLARVPILLSLGNYRGFLGTVSRDTNGRDLQTFLELWAESKMRTVGAHLVAQGGTIARLFVSIRKEKAYERSTGSFKLSGIVWVARFVWKSPYGSHPSWRCATCRILCDFCDDMRGARPYHRGFSSLLRDRRDARGLAALEVGLVGLRRNWRIIAPDSQHLLQGLYPSDVRPDMAANWAEEILRYTENCHKRALDGQGAEWRFGWVVDAGNLYRCLRSIDLKSSPSWIWSLMRAGATSRRWDLSLGDLLSRYRRVGYLKGYHPLWTSGPLSSTGIGTFAALRSIRGSRTLSSLPISTLANILSFLGLPPGVTKSTERLVVRCIPSRTSDKEESSLTDLVRPTMCRI